MMKRHEILPRHNWQERVENLGFTYHTIDGVPYWNEGACYVLDSELIDKIDDATQELHDMCILYVEKAIASGNYEGYDFSDETISLIEKSWMFGHAALYGRFDLGINNYGDIKMFEYNADTPTSLLEASVIQWDWKESLFPDKDQFNSIHEKLIEQFQFLNVPHIHFATMSDAPHEDWGNLHYLLSCQSETSMNATSINLEEIGWDSATNQFVDLNNRPITHLFKLYPWEWMMKDAFAQNISKSNTFFIEPAWKMLLSNKLLLVKLWENHPYHRLLLPAYTNESIGRQTINLNNYLIKPMLGREGNGIRSAGFRGMTPDNNVDVGGKSWEIYQEKFKTVYFYDHATMGPMHPVIGSWIIGNKTAGIGIREDVGITTNNSKFVPHYFE